MTDEREAWLNTPDPGTVPADLPFLALEDTFVSGDRTGHRFRIRYYHAEDSRRLLGKILFGPGAQGPPDHVHGGAMAAILDEAMGGVAWLSGHPVVAANLDLTFRQMLPLATPCLVEAEIVAVEGRKVTTRGVLRDREGQTVFSEGKALFVVLDKRHLDDMAGKADVIVERMREQRRRRDG
jgi:acyl-coenzyme A thioesterase PaaI-like protein